jgi:hypothetical protein
MRKFIIYALLLFFVTGAVYNIYNSPKNEKIPLELLPSDTNSSQIIEESDDEEFAKDIVLQNHFSVDEYYDPKCPYRSAASYISVDIEYPQVILQSSEKTAKAVNTVLKKLSLQDKIDESTTYKITSEVTYFQNNLLSVVYKGSLMHCEDRHPYTWYSTANFNLKNGHRYKIDDIFNANAISLLHLKVKEYFYRKYPNKSKSMDFNTTDLLDDFTLNDENITIYFDMYQIGAGYLDVMSATIPFSSLDTNKTKQKSLFKQKFLKVTDLLD